MELLLPTHGDGAHISLSDEPSFFLRNRSIFTLALIGDLRNNVVSPTRGAFWNVTAQAAPEMLGASSKFVKVYGQVYTFVSLGGGVVWASGYRLGLTTTTANLSMRMTASRPAVRARFEASNKARLAPSTSASRPS